MKTSTIFFFTALGWGVLNQGCAEDLDPGQRAPSGASDSGDSGDAGGLGGSGDPGGTTNDIPSRSGHFSHDVLRDGRTIQTTVDASDYEEWQFLDLDKGRAVDADDAADGLWDLKFRRFFVLSNGGETGTKGVELALCEDRAFEDVDAHWVKKLENNAWHEDQRDAAADEDDEPDNVFNNGEYDWYDYDSSSHTLTSKGLVYLARTNDGRIFKMQLLDYYDEAGTPAFLSFHWAEVLPD